VLIINNCQLKQFYQECQKDKYIGVDTEFYWVGTYKPIPCLIQISNSKRIVLIDLINSNLKLKYLKLMLINPNILKIFHSARQDIEIFFNLFGILPKSIFDTQLGTLPLGFEQSMSLKKICKIFLDIEINKEVDYKNWKERPLKKKQIIYARNDVKYLIKLYLEITKKLNAINRLHWIRRIQEKLLDKKLYDEKEKNAWKKIKIKLSFKSELENLKKITLFRETLAKNYNLPPKKILDDNFIPKLVKKNLSLEQKKKIIDKITDPNLHTFLNKNILKKVKSDEKANHELNKNQIQKLKLAKNLLLKNAKIHNVNPLLIANKKELVELILEKNFEPLNGWKFKIFGKDYLEL
tara:strand:+ start:698 stop:1750 length:1053 start_codon:yes stop_codon:yes gene_type:complete